MIAFMTIIYVALIILIFKVMKVPPRPWPIAGVVTLGVLMLGTVVVLWTIAAPISTRAVVTRYVVQIVPYVKGQVTHIPAKPNEPLKKGDVLYEIDPAPYQYALDQIEAQLQASKSNVVQLEAGIRVAEAAVKRAEADANVSKTAFDVATTINKENPQAIAKLKLVQAEEEYAAAEAALQQAQGNVEQSRAALAAAKDTVASVESQLQTAEFNLQQCTVRAPSDGFVTNWEIRGGRLWFRCPSPPQGRSSTHPKRQSWPPFPHRCYCT